MKKQFVKYMAVPAMVLAAFLASCTTVSSDKNDDEDETALSSAKHLSSSSQKGKSSSSQDSIVEAAKDTSSYVEDEDLTAPGGISAVRMAPSIWMLNWSFDGSGDAGDGFVVQRLSPNATAWEDFGKVGAGVTHLLLDGELKGNYYYRVATYSNKSRSAYSSEVFVSTNTEYDVGLDFAVPTISANVIQDSVLEIIMTGGFPTQEMEKSPYNYDSTGKKKGEVFYEARFVYGSEYAVDTVKSSVDKSSIIKKFKNIADQCNAFAQVRTVWKDRNGIMDYSDWTTPVGTKSGTESGLVDPNKRCSEVVSTSEGVAGFASPSNLEASQLSDGTWILEWAYTPLASRPAEGFVVQKLDLKKSAWNDLGKTGEGVTRYPLGVVTEEYSYYRVAAFDADGRSAFTTDVLVSPSKAATVSLAAPTGLALESPEDSVVMLSWSYADVNAIKGFVIQKLNLKDNKWVVETSLDKSVLRFDVKTSENIRYYRVGAFNSSDTSYSADILVPSKKKTDAAKAAMAAPSNLQVSEVSKGALVLSWSYVNVAEHPAVAFVVQLLDVETGIYSDIVNVKDVSVLRTAIETSDVPRYIRVVALDGTEDGVANSPDLLVPAYEENRIELPAPSGLAVSEIDASSLLLSWKYSASAKRPNAGFKVEKLNGSYEWEGVGFAKANVNMFKIATDENVARYFRISAYDVDGTDTTFASSEEVLVPVYKVDRTLASPTNLVASEYQMTKYILSWKFTDNVNNKASGFELQQLELTSNSWTKVDALMGTAVMRMVIETPKSMTLYRVAAFTDTDTTYSNEVTITPGEINYKIGIPQNFKFTEYGEMQYIFSWDFEDNALRPISGFVVQFFNGTDWEDIADSETKLTGSELKHYVIDNPTKVTYYRLKAYVGEDNVANLPAEVSYSNEVVVSPYSVDFELPAPTNLTAVRVAPSVWVLTWEYESSKEHPAKAFVLESSSINASNWSQLGDDLDIGEMYYYVKGAEYLETQYRVAAKDESDMLSDYTTAFTLNTKIPYREDVALGTPDVKGYMVVDITVDGSDTTWEKVSMEVAGIAALVNKNIVNSVYSKNVKYQVRWFTAIQDADEGVTEDLDATENQPAFAREISSGETGADGKRALMEACKYYAQMRVVWTDIFDGVDYSEWSDPIIFKDLEGANICK